MRARLAARTFHVPRWREGSSHAHCQRWLHADALLSTSCHQLPVPTMGRQTVLKLMMEHASLTTITTCMVE